MNLKPLDSQIDLGHLINGQWNHDHTTKVHIHSPYTGDVIGNYHGASNTLVNKGIEFASEAFESWGKVPLKERTQVMFRLTVSLM